MTFSENSELTKMVDFVSELNFNVEKGEMIRIKFKQDIGKKNKR